MRVFRMTASSFHYDERRHQPLEFEMYFKISRRARTGANIKRVRSVLERKGRRHFHYWLLKYLKVRMEREVRVNFEHEERAKKQIVDAYATVRRLVMRKINRRWEAQELPQGTMRFAKRWRRHGRK